MKCDVKNNSPSSAVKNRYYACLPVHESLFYWVFGVGSIIYTFYEMYQESQRLRSKLPSEYFVKGWFFLPYEKDSSNFGWSFWAGYIWVIVPWGAGHIALSCVLNRYAGHGRKYWYLCYGLLSITYLLGCRGVLVIIVYAYVCYLVSSFGNVFLVWIASLATLSSLNYDEFVKFMRITGAFTNVQWERQPVFFSILPLATSRFTSFCLERIKFMKTRENNSDDGGFTLLNMLTHIFYMPIVFVGPLISYDEFTQQMDAEPQPLTRSHALTAVYNLARLFCWGAFIEFSYHFLYYGAMLHSPAAMEQMSTWCLIGMSYIQGQYFMIYHALFYGLPFLVAKFDGIDLPREPRCISVVYSYTDMWKYFDRGLHAFMKKYIFIPLGGSRSGIPRQLFASVVCFLYVYVWHGETKNILIWVTLNFLGVTLELIGGHLDRTSFVEDFKKAYLSPAMVRRIHCSLYTPLYIMSVHAIFYFFNDLDNGDIFLRRFVTHATTKTRVLAYCVFYANIQNALEIERLYAGRMK